MALCLPAIAVAESDIAMSVRGIERGARKTLVFSATNAGPNVAAGVQIQGTVTVNFDEVLDADAVRAKTGMVHGEDAICARRVDDVDPVDRWTLPVTCTLADVAVGQLIEFEFWFDDAVNAQYRIRSQFGSLDQNQANDVVDGTFLNTPTEVLDVDDEGCCATVAATPRTPAPVGVLLALLAVRVHNRRAT